MGKDIGRIHRLPGLLSLAIQQYLTSIPVKWHSSGLFGFRVLCFQSYTAVLQIHAIPLKTQQLSTTATRMQAKDDEVIYYNYTALSITDLQLAKHSIW